jgi:uncharacterized 2Fe-2S/4Fe-4S cluster protein (DUF4445 family)
MSRPLRLQVELDTGERRELAVAADGRTLADLLGAGGLPLNTRCGQRGLCRGCEVLLRAGAVSGEPGTISAPATIRACQARPSGPAVIHVPDRSRIKHRPQVCETFEIFVPCAHQPRFPSVPGARDTAFAVDVGTTTVVVLLVDLTSGDVLSQASAFNEQIRFGDNVVTRIEAAGDPEQFAAMRRAVAAETIQPLLLRACAQAGRGPGRIAGGVIAGNTTMLHLLAGEDPTPLGVAPFTPRFLAARQLAAGEIGLAADGLGADTPVQLLPGIAAYIGADIAAGIVATGMSFDAGPSLLVDIGTNGEIVLQSGGRLFACATAAGPAFEGSGLRCGTRAQEGAVSRLRLALSPFRLEARTIGDVPLGRSHGVCGSAYIDFLATARSSGLLNRAGRFEAAAWAQVPVANRQVAGAERAVGLASANGAPGLRISEADVALLLQAKAAIGAGIEVLLETAGARAAEVSRVYLAGGFGMHIDVQHAIDIGLLPGFRPEQVCVAGNSSLAGALLALVDRALLEEMESLRAQVEVIELNLVGGFEERYIEHLMLP